LVNGRFGDPVVYVKLLFEKRALLLDLGDLHALSPRQILQVSDILVFHTHMDHFLGFDRFLRLVLGRDSAIRLYGPAGFIDQVEHKLAAYTWNLVHRYETDLALEVTEVLSQDLAKTATFRLQRGFRREAASQHALVNGIILDDQMFALRAAVLDHDVPCLGFAIEEKEHVNVWRNRLDALGLPTGPWLRELKRAVVRGDPDDTVFRARWREGDRFVEREFMLGQLKREILKIVPGQKLAYVVDVAFNEENARRIARLAQDADILFIEAPFDGTETVRGLDRFHLTTTQAGQLARRARAKVVEPFHFSPRHSGDEKRLIAEVQDAFLVDPDRFESRLANE
jgi:ribonuclease Z